MGIKGANVNSCTSTGVDDGDNGGKWLIDFSLTAFVSSR